MMAALRRRRLGKEGPDLAQVLQRVDGQVLGPVSQQRHAIGTLVLHPLQQVQRGGSEAASARHHHGQAVELPQHLLQHAQDEVPRLGGASALQRTEGDGAAPHSGLAHGEVQRDVLQEGLGLRPARGEQHERLHTTQVRPDLSCRAAPESGLEKMLVRVESRLRRDTTNKVQATAETRHRPTLGW
jgi:hypothetical protein